MSSDSSASGWSKKLTIDPALFKPTPDESAFLKAQTGIQDDGKLKEHVLAVQEEAWKVSCLQVSHRAETRWNVI